MENEINVTPFNTGIKYGTYLGILSCLLMLIVHYGGLQDYSDPAASSNMVVSLVQWILVFGLIYLGVRYYRSHNEGLLTLGEGLTTSMYIGLFSGIILGLFSYIFVAYIAPEMMDAVTDAIDFDEMSEEEAAMAEDVVGMFVSPTFMAFSAFIGRVIAAFFFGLIAAFILKRGD